MNCVYKIVCKDPTITEFYIGSTNNLDRRISQHERRYNNTNSPKSNYKVYKFIRQHEGLSNWEINPIEIYECEMTKLELRKNEQFYIDEYKPQLNTCYAIGENKEEHKKKTKIWRENNVEHIKEYNKKMKEHYSKWRKDNREELLKKKRDYSSKKIKCDICGNIYRQDYIKKHIKNNH